MEFNISNADVTKETKLKNYIFIFLIYLMLSGYKKKNSYEEKMKIYSSDGRVGAALIEVSTHATVSSVYELFIFETSSAPDFDLDPISRMDKIDRINLEWNDDLLKICIDDNARIWKFSNFWSSLKLENHKRIIKLEFCKL